MLKILLDCPFKWSPETFKAFEESQIALLNSAEQGHPEGGAQLSLEVDARGFRIQELLFSCLPPPVSCLSSLVSHLSSPISRLLSHVSPFPYPVSCLTSPLLHHPIPSSPLSPWNTNIGGGGGGGRRVNRPARRRGG